MAATSAALGLMYLAVHLVYGSSLLLAWHALSFALSYVVVMVMVALRASEPFWRAMGKTSMGTCVKLRSFLLPNCCPCALSDIAVSLVFTTC